MNRAVNLYAIGGGWWCVLEPSSFFIQEPQIGGPKEKVQKSKDLKLENNFKQFLNSKNKLN